MKPEGSTYPSLGCTWPLRLLWSEKAARGFSSTEHWHSWKTSLPSKLIYKVLSAPRRLIYSFSVPKKLCIWVSQCHILYLDHSSSTAKFSFANKALFLPQHSVLILLADYSYYLFPINFHEGRIFLSLLLTNMLLCWAWSKNTKLLFEFPFEFLLSIS